MASWSLHSLPRATLKVRCIFRRSNIASAGVEAGGRPFARVETRPRAEEKPWEVWSLIVCRQNRMLVCGLLVCFLGCAASQPDAEPTADPVEVLIVWADAEPDEGEAPLAVELFCDPLEVIEEPQYVWDPGDGSDRLEGQRVTHTYRRPGTYKARVVVRDNVGNVGDDEVSIDVDPSQ